MPVFAPPPPVWHAGPVRTRSLLNPGLLVLLAWYAPSPVAAGAEFDAINVLAEQGQADGQYNLGSMYSHGQGVAQDDVEAHKWYNLAAGQGNADATRNRDIVAARMSPAQIAEARKLAREWKPGPAGGTR